MGRAPQVSIATAGLLALPKHWNFSNNINDMDSNRCSRENWLIFQSESCWRFVKLANCCWCGFPEFSLVAGIIRMVKHHITRWGGISGISRVPSLWEWAEQNNSNGRGLGSLPMGMDVAQWWRCSTTGGSRFAQGRLEFLLLLSSHIGLSPNTWLQALRLCEPS